MTTFRRSRGLVTALNTPNTTRLLVGFRMTKFMPHALQLGRREAGEGGGRKEEGNRGSFPACRGPGHEHRCSQRRATRLGPTHTRRTLRAPAAAGESQSQPRPGNHCSAISPHSPEPVGRAAPAPAPTSEEASGGPIGPGPQLCRKQPGSGRSRLTQTPPGPSDGINVPPQFPAQEAQAAPNSWAGSRVKGWGPPR